MSDFMHEYGPQIFLAIVVGWILWTRMLAPKLAGVHGISAEDYMTRWRNKPHTLLDVRSEGEWQNGHAPGALHIPLQELSRRMREIPDNKPVICICASGNRSSMASYAIAKAGRKPVYNFSGGMGAWSGAGLPVKQGT